MVRAPHPPDSPDLAPSDFCLFGYFKSKLHGGHFETGEGLLAAILALLDTIEKVTLEMVFLQWMERLTKCLSTNDEYVGGDE
jgi:hypothetical protein